MGRAPVASNATKAERKVNQDGANTERERQAELDWEKTEAGKTLKRLKAEEQSRRRGNTEFDISDVPLPRSNPR